MPNRHRIHQVILEDRVTLFTAGPVQIQQSLTSGETYVCQFDLYGRPTIRVGQVIDVRQVDYLGHAAATAFHGRINKISASHFPHQVTVTCQGPLAKLRRARLSGDHTLNGLTDGEAIQYLFGYCGIAYDPALIADAGLVLGPREDIFFKEGQSAQSFVAALDDLLGMCTLELPDGTPCRFAYSLVPADYPSGYITLAADGSDVYVYENQRDHGDIDAIRNAVAVTGASWECGADNQCTCTPWAKSNADNGVLGSGVRTEALSTSSEFIQDEATAAALATRLMRWNNRQPDSLRLVAPNYLNVIPGRPVDVIDPVYGIGLPTATRYLVTEKQQEGDIMTLTLTGGAAGVVGPVSTGVEQVCSERTNPGDIDIPGAFSVPSVDVPGVVVPGPYGTGDGCYDLLAADQVDGWSPPPTALATWTFSPGALAVRNKVFTVPAAGYYGGHQIAPGTDWWLTAVFQVNQSRSAGMVGITQSQNAQDFYAAASGTGFGAINDAEVQVFNVVDGHDQDFLHDVDNTVVAHWDALAHTLSVTGMGAPITVHNDSGATLWKDPAVPFILTSMASGGSLAADTILFSKYQFCINQDPGAAGAGGCLSALASPLCEDWTESDPPWGFTGTTGHWITTCGGSMVATVFPCSAGGPSQLGWGVANYLRTGIPARAAAWIMSVAGSHALDDAKLYFSVIDDSGGTAYSEKVGIEWPSTGDGGNDHVFVDESGGADYEAVGSHSLGTTFVATIERDHDVFRFLLESPPGTTVLAQTLATNWNAAATDGDLMIEVVAFSEGSSSDHCTGGTLTVTDVSICRDSGACGCAACASSLVPSLGGTGWTASSGFTVTWSPLTFHDDGTLFGGTTWLDTPPIPSAAGKPVGFCLNASFHFPHPTGDYVQFSVASGTSDGTFLHDYLVQVHAPGHGDPRLFIAAGSNSDQAQANASFAAGDALSIQMKWRPEIDTLEAILCVNGVQTATCSVIATGGQFTPGALSVVVAADSGGHGQPDPIVVVDNLEVTYNCGSGLAVIPADDWHERTGWEGADVTFPADGSIVDAEEAIDFEVYQVGTNTPFDGSRRVRLTGHVEFPGATGGEEDVIATIALQAPPPYTPFFFSSFEVEWDAGDTVSHFAIYGFEEYTWETAPGVDVWQGFDFLIDWNPGTGTVSYDVHADSGAHHTGSAALGAWPGAVTPTVGIGKRDDPVGMTITGFSLLLGG